MSELLEQFSRVLASRRPAALATLVAAKGATPKKAGATMWVGAGGAILGSVTIGGCVDARVIEQADEVIGSGQPRLLSMSLGDEDAWELGLTCGGAVDVLVQRVDASDMAEPAVIAYSAARAAYDAGRASIVIAPLADGPQRLTVDEDDTVTGTLGDPDLDASAIEIARDRMRVGAISGVERVDHRGGERALYFERLAPADVVVIYGAGEVAVSLATFAHELGMRTIVVDGRERFATRERFPHADELHVGMPSEVAEQLPATGRMAAVLLAHDYKYELPVLRHLLRSEVGYIGMLGSRKRGDTIRTLLAEDGFSPGEISRIHTPIGLDIGARSAAEIALAVAAEIVAVREGRNAPGAHATRTAAARAER